MEKNIIALFDSAGGPKQVDEVVEYRSTPEGRRYAEFKATDGAKYLGYLDEIRIVPAPAL